MKRLDRRMRHYSPQRSMRTVFLLSKYFYVHGALGVEGETQRACYLLVSGKC